VCSSDLLLSLAVGRSNAQFRLPGGGGVVRTRIDVAPPSAEMTIAGYEQLSPTAAGLRNETRDLGIALWRVTFEPLDASRK
jgi:hypothetical protein